MKRNLPDAYAIPKSQGKIVRCSWTKSDDELLIKYVDKHKERKWNLIAKAVTKESNKLKTAKQCRERWHTRLDPKILLSAWSNEEEARLFLLHKQIGNKWAEIAKCLPGRTDNSIKNYFFCSLRRLIRAIKNESFCKIENLTYEKIDQIAYLLDHIYKFYISPDKIQYLEETTHYKRVNKKNSR